MKCRTRKCAKEKAAKDRARRQYNKDIRIECNRCAYDVLDACMAKNPNANCPSDACEKSFACEVKIYKKKYQTVYDKYFKCSEEKC